MQCYISPKKNFMKNKLLFSFPRSSALVMLWYFKLQSYPWIVSGWWRWPVMKPHVEAEFRVGLERWAVMTLSSRWYRGVSFSGLWVMKDTEFLPSMPSGTHREGSTDRAPFSVRSKFPLSGSQLCEWERIK